MWTLLSYVVLLDKLIIMDNLRISTLTTKDLKSGPKSGFQLFLAQYSEIGFIYTAIPSFLLSFIGLITGVILFVHKKEYFRCKKQDDLLFGFLLGQMIFYYSFFVIYSNLLFQLVPMVNSLTVTFALFIVYFVGNTGWSLFGITVLEDTGCIGSVYAGMAGFTIAFSLLFDFALMISLIVLIVKKNRKVKVSHERVFSEVKFVEQNSGLDDINVNDF